MNTSNQNPNVSIQTNRNKHWGAGMINGSLNRREWHPYQGKDFLFTEEAFRKRHMEADRELKQHN